MQGERLEKPKLSMWSLKPRMWPRYLALKALSYLWRVVAGVDPNHQADKHREILEDCEREIHDNNEEIGRMVKLLEETRAERDHWKARCGENFAKVQDMQKRHDYLMGENDHRGKLLQTLSEQFSSWKAEHAEWVKERGGK